jgi:hypothetical protein
MAGHTPGPWNLFCKNGVISVFAKDGDVVSWLGFDDSNRSKEEHEANARLVTASPDMVAALKKALPSVCSLTCKSIHQEGEKRTHSEDCQAVRDAIYKATGERFRDNPSFSMWPLES